MNIKNLIAINYISNSVQLQYNSVMIQTNIYTYLLHRKSFYLISSMQIICIVRLRDRFLIYSQHFFDSTSWLNYTLSLLLYYFFQVLTIGVAVHKHFVVAASVHGVCICCSGCNISPSPVRVDGVLAEVAVRLRGHRVHHNRTSHYS